MSHTSTPTASGQLEFWFEFASNYSYLSVMRIEQAAAKVNVRILWKPFLLGPIFRSFGWNTSPFVLQKAKGDYVWKDMDRLCRKYGLPWKKPSAFPRSALLPTRVALVGADEPWVGPFCKQMMLINFAENRDVDSPDVVAGVLTQIGLDHQAIIDAAQSDANKLKLREQTDEAAARGLFGAPSFFAGNEMFWGNDRLEDALAYCIWGNR